MTATYAPRSFRSGKRIGAVPVLIGTFLALLALALPAASQAMTGGLLRVHPDNPRYLTNKSGKAILLVGPHTWHVFQDYDDERASVEFDYDAWLDELRREKFNFFRGWTWEDGYYSPIAFRRVTVQGRRVYALDRWNAAYFQRIRNRVEQAGRRGLYTSVMLFQGWSVDNRKGLRRPDPWLVHPFNPSNNSDRRAVPVHRGTELDPVHDEYLQRMVAALWDLDNFIWEVGNELDSRSAPWKRQVIQRVSELEDAMSLEAGLPANAPRRHLIWASCIGRKIPMPAYGADIISPCNVDGYGPTPARACTSIRRRSNPPAASGSPGSPIVISDSDHLEPLAVDLHWAWRSFIRGLHPIVLVAPEGRDSLPWFRGPCNIDRGLENLEEIRAALTVIRSVAKRFDLARAVPQGKAAAGKRNPVSSTGFALYTSRSTKTSAKPDGRQFLVLQPATAGAAEPVTICGLKTGRTYRATWRRLTNGSIFGQGDRSRVKSCETYRGSSAGGILELKLKN